MICLKEVSLLTLERLFLYTILLGFFSWFLIEHQINLYLGCFLLIMFVWGFLKIFIRFTPGRYVLNINEQGMRYFKFSSVVYLSWDEFQGSKIVSNYFGGKQLCIFNTAGKPVIQYRGTINLNLYQLRDFLNSLFQAYRRNELKSENDLVQVFNKFLAEDKADEKELIEKSVKIIKSSKKIDSIISTNAPYYILKFPHFWLRVLGAILFFVSLGLLPNLTLITIIVHYNPLIPLSIFMLMMFAFCLVYLLYSAKSIVFYEAQNKFAYRICFYFGQYYLSGKILNNISKIEMSGNGQSFYNIILSNEGDKIFCGMITSRWSAVKIVKRISSILNLPIFSFFDTQLNILDLIFYIINYVIIIVLVGGLFFVNRGFLAFLLHRFM